MRFGYFEVAFYARILESMTPNQGSRFLVRIMVSADEKKEYMLFHFEDIWRIF